MTLMVLTLVLGMDTKQTVGTGSQVLILVSVASLILS